MDVSKWRSQMRKGLLEYCLLHVVRSSVRAYGLEIMEALTKNGLPISEGTLYPLLSRLLKEELLSAQWETENISGHPRKYYLLTKLGEKTLAAMDTEWDSLLETIQDFQSSTVKSSPRGNNESTK